MEEQQQVCVRVALRVRPAIIPNQLSSTPCQTSSDRPITRNCIKIIPNEPQVVIGREESSQKSFTFDYVYGPSSTQEEIYQELVEPLVGQFLQGFNATILAYGQTYSGKTYTMGSSNDSCTLDQDFGIIPRVFNDICHFVDNHEPGFQPILRVSFLEIYQEQIRDLLMPNSLNKEISIRENKGNIVVAGVHEEIVKTVQDMKRCLIAGGIERTTGDTLMHMHSSRSHAIFTITLEILQIPAHDNDEMNHVVVRRSKLQLVDLAGSERLKRTGAEGLRLKESVKINSGLLALGNVISILGEEKTGDPTLDRQTHIPYRDSKLTRLLQDSLGGNSQTIMLACVSPLHEDTDETINSMKYAYRARKIRNKPVVNVIDQLALERTSMQQKISQLEGKLRGMEQESSVPSQIGLGMADFDFENDEWMQFFVNQLKDKTTRGTNAVKALEEAKQEIFDLHGKISRLEDEAAVNLKAAQRAKADDAEYLSSIHSMQATIDKLVYYCYRVILKGDSPNQTETEPILDILKKYYPNEKLSRSASKDSLATFSLPAINNSYNSNKTPSSNSVARTHRRKRITSEDHPLVRDGEDIHLKPLEMELRETRKYLAQMEEELNRTRIRLQQTEAVSEKSSQEISRLMDVNESFKTKNYGLGIEKRDEGQEVVSMKVIADAGTQTHDPAIPGGILDGSFITPNQGEMSVEKLTEELSIATKVKVDLLKELSKVNKDAEKTRHAHGDQILKLERELEASQRDMNKLVEEHHEKDSAKERLRDDHERKIKQHESTILKLKQKLKEFEKTLKDKGSGDRRLSESQQEIEKLVLNITNLKKKIKDDHDRFVEMENRKAKELTVLNKQLEEESKKSRQLEVKAEMMRKKLDRKTEEVATLGKKRDSLTSINRNSRLSMTGNSTENSSRKNDSFVSEGEKPATLEAVTDDLSRMRDKIHEIEEQLPSLNSEGQEYRQLEASKEELVMQVAELHNEMRKLRKTQRSIEVDNNDVPLVDNSKVALEWERLSFLVSSNPERFSQIFENAPTANAPQCRRYLIDCLQEVVSLQEQIENQTIENQHERDQVDLLEKRIQKVIRAYEKKITGLTNADNANLGPQSVSEEVQTEEQVSKKEKVQSTDTNNMEKDVFYYRNVNKELKSKLREVVAVNHRLAKTLQMQAESSSAKNPDYPVAV